MVTKMLLKKLMRWRELHRTTKRNLLIGSLMVIAGVALSIKWGQSVGLVAGMFIIIGGGMLSEGLLRASKLDEIAQDADQAQEKLAEMISAARQRILITSGCLDAGAWVRWQNGKVAQLLRAKLEQQVEVEIVTGEIDQESWPVFKDLLGKFPKQLRIYQYQGNPAPHGLLVDDAQLRLESRHTLGARILTNSFASLGY